MAFVGDQEASSSTQRCTYQVFLSFRGVDTRRTFTSHLYTALKNAGIHTFKDDIEISRGKTIRLELEKGVNQSSASIIVFSKDYASSRWCLDELAMILERKRASKHIVLPIFYDVDPTNVRRLSGSIGRALAMYDKKVEGEANKARKNKLMENITKWRAALKEAAEISGMELKKEANGDEAKFIQKVVNMIQNKLRPKTMDAGPYLVGMPSRTRDVNLWIRDANRNSSIMVICGMGGIGKTTIAKFVYNDNYKDFDSCSFLSNIRERSKEPKGLIDLQSQLLSDICKRKKACLYNVDQGILEIRDAIGGQRVLLVLDDVDHINQMNALFRMKDSFFPGSKIVITTRNEKLIKSSGVYEVYKVKTLGGVESVDLFSFHAFPQGHSTELYMEQTRKIVDLCKGLPLALQILGSSLVGKNSDVWTGLLKKLETIPDSDIVEKLKTSYDSLPDDDVKNIFLHIACFFSGEDYDSTVEILNVCEMHAVVGIDYLLDRCLLVINSDKKIIMHQLIRDMGRDIVRKESPEEPGERSRLWHSQDCFDVLREKTGTKTVKALAFYMEAERKENSYDMDLETDAFAMMQRLKFLQLNNVELTGSYGEFPKRLRWLSWRRCLFEYIPNDLSMQRLICLDMQHSSLIQLWKDPKRLPALKILNLSHSKRLSVGPDFSNLPKLEKLILKGCTELVDICESITYAKGLILLNVKNCRKLTKLPRNISKLISLEILVISGCSGLEEFPLGLKNLRLLKLFHADGIDMNALISLAKEIESQASFPQFIGELSLTDCKLSNDSFPKDLSNLSLLKILNLDGNVFTSLPDCCRTLSKLEELSLNHCPLLHSIIGLPKKLKYLLRGGYTNSAEMTHVEYIQCHDCHSLVEVEGCYKKVSIKYVDRRIRKNLGLLELEQTLIELDLYKDIKVTLEYGVFSTWVPGDELPRCFTCKNVDTKSTSFTVPSDFKVEGMTVGFVFTEKRQEGHYKMSVAIYNQTKGLKWSYGVHDYMDEEVVWLLYFKTGTLLEAGDEVTASVRDGPKMKEFGVKIVYFGENDDDAEVYDHDKLTTEHNNAARVSSADQTFLQLSDFQVSGTSYLFGRANVEYCHGPTLSIYIVGWSGWHNVPPFKYLRYSDEPES